MGKKWLMIVVVGALLLGGGAYFGYQQLQGPDEDSSAPVLADALRIESDFNMVTADGRVVPSVQATLSTLSGGPVIGLFVEEGDLVQTGDPLLQLDITDETIAVQIAEAAVALADANLSNASSNLELAQIGLDSALLAVRDVQLDLAIAEAGATAEQIALSEVNVAVAEAGIIQAAGNRSAALEGASSAEIAAAEAQLAFAQSEYDNAVKSYQPILQDAGRDEDERDQAALMLNEARAALTSAQLQLSRYQAGATSSEQMAANSGVATATNQRDAAQAQLDLLLAGTSEEQIEIAKINLTSAETGVTEAEGRVAGAETSVAQSEAALLEAQSGLALAQNELEKRTLTAPFDGSIAAVNIKEGERVQSGSPVLTLADLSRWQVETTDLTELDVVTLAQGMPVAVQIDAFPGTILGGEVREIAEAADQTGGDVTYLTTIDLLETADVALRWGMTAIVDILTEEGAMLPANVTEALPDSTIEAEGQLVPLSHIDLAFDVGGRVIAFPARQDDRLIRGDAMIELDKDDLALALSQAIAQVTTAEAGIVAAQSQLDLAQTAEAKARDALRLAEANLALVEAGPRPAEVAAAEATLAAAESAVSQAQAERNAALDTISDADIAIAESDLAAATANVLLLQDNYKVILNGCFVTADGQKVCPLYGTVEEQTRGLLEAARANQAAAQARLDFLNAGPTAAQQLAAGGAVVVATANRQVAQAQLELLLAGPSPEQIEKAEVGVAQAELGVATAQVKSAQAETAVAQAEAGLINAEASRAALQAAFDRLTLRATMNGDIIAIQPNLGETVTPGQPVATLADLSGWLVETTNVTEFDMPFIDVGDPVGVRFDAIPDRTVSGVVTKISVMPAVARGDVVYQVTVQLENASALPLRWGMTAVVEMDGNRD